MKELVASSSFATGQTNESQNDVNTRSIEEELRDKDKESPYSSKGE
jgi:hypothetical protein